MSSRVPACREIRVVLFDLGGVLLKLRNPVETFGLPISETEFKDRWLASPSVRRFESGSIDTEAFARNIVVEAKLPYDWREFIKRFDSWPEELFDRTLEVLHAIPANFRRALLSNINPLHWERETISGPLAGRFDDVFLSYQTGLVKPDHAAFDQVVRTYSCRPDEVLFLDDSQANVDSALNYGMQAVLAVGIEAVVQTLREHAILA